jgi:two-component system, NarL family, sensor kinase
MAKKLIYKSIPNFNMTKGKLTFLFLLMIIGIHVSSKNLDSLEAVLRSPTLSVEQQLKLYDDLSWDYLGVDIEKSKLLSREGIVISLKTKNDKLCGILYHHLGIACYNESQMDSALLYFRQAEEFSRKANDDFRIDRIELAYALLYDTNGEYEKAIDILMRLLPNIEKRKDISLLRTAYGNLGTLYYNVHNYALSEKYYLLSENLNEKYNDSGQLSQALNGLASVYLMEELYEKSLEYCQKALIESKRCNYDECQALTLELMSKIYCEYYKDFDKAIKMAKEGLNIAQNSCTLNDVAAMKNSLSNIYFYKGDYQNCLNFALEAICTDTTDHSVYESTVANVVKSSIYLGEKQLAIDYFERYFKIIEERNKKELHQFEIESEKKYQTGKKELQIAVLQKQKKLSSLIFISAITGLSLLMLVIYLRFKITKRNKQIAEQRIVQLEQEKQLVATQSILEGENAERTRLARDLHDGLGAMLSAIKINLFDMKQAIILEADDVSRLNRVLGILDDSTQELRRIAHNMMPESLSRYGLQVSIADFCNNFPQIRFHYYGSEERLDSGMEIMLYRIAHELINNAIKHSGAENIHVQLIREARRVSLTVQDDGRGFDRQSVTTGNGLKNITDRVYSLGGNIDINSEPGKGTEITIGFPLT